MRFKRYIAIFLFISALFAGAYELSQQAIRVGCWGGGYKDDAWMSYCASSRFGDYEHAAVWFELEPEISAKIKQANVITLSSSRLQEALSVSNSFDWFKSNGFSLYMLGFGFDEQSGFAEMLLQKFKPRPAVLIINADPYVTGQLSNPAQAIANNSEAELQTALGLKRFQEYHRAICDRLEWICRYTASGFRSRADGHWIYPAEGDVRSFGVAPQRWGRSPVVAAKPTSPETLKGYLPHADRLLTLVGIPRRCIIFTTVPNNDQSADISRYLAEATGARSVLPNLPDLQTRDTFHLDLESANRWSAAFLSELRPILDDCMK